MLKSNTLSFFFPNPNTIFFNFQSLPFLRVVPVVSTEITPEETNFLTKKTVKNGG